VWKDESEVNENAIPLWRGQGEERYKTKNKIITMKSNQNYNRELQPYAHKLRYFLIKSSLPPPEGDKLIGNDNE